MYIYITRAGIDLIPARQLAREPVRVLVDNAPGDDRPTPLERRPDRLQLFRLQPELRLQIAELRRARLGQVAEQKRPVRVGALHTRDLGAADGIEQRRYLVRDERALPAVHVDDEIAARADLAEPAELRRRPLPEPGLFGRVPRFVARLEQTRQRGIGRARQRPAVAQELFRLGERLQRAVRRQPAFVRAPFLELVECRHAAILARGCRRPQSSRSATSSSRGTLWTRTAPGSLTGSSGSAGRGRSWRGVPAHTDGGAGVGGGRAGGKARGGGCGGGGGRGPRAWSGARIRAGRASPAWRWSTRGRRETC